jgi:hypothetical protein
MEFIRVQCFWRWWQGTTEGRQSGRPGVLMKGNNEGEEPGGV